MEGWKQLAEKFGNIFAQFFLFLNPFHTCDSLCGFLTEARSFSYHKAKRLVTSKKLKGFSSKFLIQ